MAKKFRRNENLSKMKEVLTSKNFIEGYDMYGCSDCQGCTYVCDCSGQCESEPEFSSSNSVGTLLNSYFSNFNSQIFSLTLAGCPGGFPPY